jgi:hypothetical protein
VSVFLTERNGEFVISDGGWIDLGIYENFLSLEDESFQKLYYNYISSFDIRETNDNNGKKHFYKKTSKVTSIPSLVYDLATFVCFIVSSSEVEFADKEEKATKERFKKSANNFLLSLVPKQSIEFSAALGDRLDIRFNAIYKKTPTKLVLINYITGSTLNYFTSSIARANIYSEMAEGSVFNKFIHRKIILIDTNAAGYQEERSGSLLQHTMSNTHSSSVKWSEKEQLAAFLNN